MNTSFHKSLIAFVFSFAFIASLSVAGAVDPYPCLNGPGPPDTFTDCGADWTCIAGMCHPPDVDCTVTGCPDTQQCVNIGGNMGCINNVSTQTGDGTCNSTGCDRDSCGSGYRCEDSHCVADSTCIVAPDYSYQSPRLVSLASVLSRFYKVLFPLGIIFGVLMVIRAGYILMTSEGNPQKTREGQEDLSAAILGTMFVVLSAAILRIIIVQVLGGSVGF